MSSVTGLRYEAAMEDAQHALIDERAEELGQEYIETVEGVEYVLDCFALQDYHELYEALAQVVKLATVDSGVRRLHKLLVKKATEVMYQRAVSQVAHEAEAQ